MAEPRWLSAQEQHAWRSFIEGFRTLVDVLDRQLQVDSNLSHAYYEVLVPLSEEPCHALRMSELADRARSSRSRLSHAVSRLEERGLVERLDCPTDKRGQVARLTDQGFAVVQAAAPGHVAAVRGCLIDRLSPEQLAVMAELGEIMLGSTAERASTSASEEERSEVASTAERASTSASEEERSEVASTAERASQRGTSEERSEVASTAERASTSASDECSEAG